MNNYQIYRLAAMYMQKVTAKSLLWHLGGDSLYRLI